jgi:hypothetical protein
VVEFNGIKIEAIIFSKHKKKMKMTIDIGDNIKVPYNKGDTR